MELRIKHYVGIVFGFLIILLDLILFYDFSKFSIKMWYFGPILVIGLFMGGISFIVDILKEGRRQKELETKFLEFVRALVETVRSGVTIPQSVLHVRDTDFGSLSPYVKKLSNQIEWGYPLHDALKIFAKDTKNEVINRSIAIVIEAEKSGGDMGSVLEAVTSSVLEIKKVKDERKANSYSQTVQGYIVFFVFVVIMIVLQLFLIPKISTLSGDLGSGLGTIGLGASGTPSDVSFASLFLASIVVQGLFAGLMLGKFAEGDFLSGLKHSLIMVVGGYLIATTITGIFEPKETVIALTLLVPRGIKLKWKRKD